MTCMCMTQKATPLTLAKSCSASITRGSVSSDDSAAMETMLSRRRGRQGCNSTPRSLLWSSVQKLRRVVNGRGGGGGGEEKECGDEESGRECCGKERFNELVGCLGC